MSDEEFLRRLAEVNGWPEVRNSPAVSTAIDVVLFDAIQQALGYHQEPNAYRVLAEARDRYLDFIDSERETTS